METNNKNVLKSRVIKCLGGTPRGGLVPKQTSGTWGDRGKGNEIQSALEKGLSWIGDKFVNGADYLEDGFNYLVTAPLAVVTGKTKEIPRVINLMRELRYNMSQNYAMNPVFDLVSPIKGGWMLKGLMKGSPLEKQLSKTGTININGLQAYLNKASKLELDIIGKILSGQFAGLKNIDYNALRKAVLDELITYSRKPQNKYSTYGMNKLGFDKKQEPDGAGGIVEYVPNVKTLTFTFESPRVPGGDGRHYDETTLGHSRTYTTPDEPEVLHVMESLSDWAQNKIAPDLRAYFPEEQLGVNWAIKRILEPYREKFITAYPLFTKHYDDYIQAGRLGQSPRLDNDFADAMELILPYDRFENVINRYARIKSGKNLSQYNYLQLNYLPRQLQENMIFAAEQGLKKMRYPTSETAAKIEGYKKTYPEPEYSMLRLQNKAYQQSFENGALSYDRYLELTDRVMKRLREIQGLGLSYSPEHQTILKKYSDFPKMFGKLFKGLEVRTVTDPKGNTWYEVDIPENFLLSEWQFKKGGSLKNKPTLISKVKKHLGGGLTYSKEQEAVKRALASKSPASNYSDAVDMDIWKPREVVTDWVLRLGNFFGAHARTGLSNCTLTASQWVNPDKPIGRAASIVTNPGKHLFSQIPEEYAIPGTLVIASKDPAQYKDGVDNVYHTMLLTGFADKDYDFSYGGKDYKIKKGEPLVDYSRGLNMASELRRNIPLSVYNDLGEGKTFNRFYKPQDNRIALAFLPEVMIKPQ